VIFSNGFAKYLNYISDILLHTTQKVTVRLKEHIRRRGNIYVAFVNLGIMTRINGYLLHYFMYSTTPHTVTKYTAYEVLFGRKANILGQLQQRTATVYNYDDVVHNYDIVHEVK